MGLRDESTDDDPAIAAAQKEDQPRFTPAFVRANRRLVADHLGVMQHR